MYSITVERDDFDMKRTIYMSRVILKTSAVELNKDKENRLQLQSVPA